MHMVLKTAAFAFGSLILAASAAAQDAPKAGATAPQQAPRRGGFAPRPQPANQPAITATLGVHRSGSFTGVIDPASNQLCYLLDAPAVANPTAARIGLGMAGQAGQTVVTLADPADGSSGACQAIPAELAQALTKDPHKYYVEVDTAAFPHGAVSAQLTGAHQMAG